MPFAKCKVYSDGSHYIAIPPKPQKPRPKKGAKVKKEAPDLEELDDDETEDCPFDKPAQPVHPVQLSLFDESAETDSARRTEGTETDEQDNALTPAEPEAKTKIVPTRKEIFERLYAEHIFKPRWKRKAAIVEGMLPYSKDYEDAKLFTELNLRRKRNNLIARRIRMTRKANLQKDFNYFVTLTYNGELHTEESFKKGVRVCLKNFSLRKDWKCIGVWERSPEKQRLHFHGIFYIPEGTMPGQMIDVNDYNFKSHRRRITHQNTYFNERFGRSDFERISDDGILNEAMSYILKYIEKTGEKIVYFGDLPQFFVSDVMENDILCTYGEDEQKFILSDTFGCWDDGEYVGQVSKETIAKLPKAN